MLHNQHVIDCSKCAGPVRNDYGNAATGTDAQNSLRQCFFAFAIEVLTRLVEDDKKGISIEGPRERNTLALSGGKGHATFADEGAITIG